MPSSVEQLSPSRVKLTIQIPFTELKPHLDKAYREIAQNVTIPGFRKGKVPAAVINQRFGRGAVLQEAINEALPTAYSAAVAEAKLAPLGEPEIEITKLEDNDLVEFTAELDVRPDFELPDFATLAATVDPIRDRETEIDERIDVMRQRFATRADVDREAQEGDVVVIDISASKDGEEIEDARAEGVTYKVGADGMIDGLDTAVTGKKAGEEVDFTSTLVGGPLKGEEAQIHVVVTKVQAETLPEVDDDFAQMISEFDTVGEMRDDLGTRVDQMLRLEQVQDARDKVLEDLIGKVEFEVPAGVLEREIAGRKDQINNQLAQAGYSLERYLQESDDEPDTEEEFWAQVEEQTGKALKAQIILDKLADDDEIGVEQAELTEMLFRRAAQNGSSPEQEMQHMMEHNHAGEWMQEIRRTKALQKIVGAATVTDADGKAVDVSKVQADGTLAEDDQTGAEEQTAIEDAQPVADQDVQPVADQDVAPAAAEVEADADGEDKPAKKKSGKKKKDADEAE